MVLGVNYGRNGNNLPSPKYVISLYQRCGIEFIRLYEPNRKVLEALQRSNLLLSLGVRNQDRKNVARNASPISLDYAKFNAKQPILDGNLEYYSLFDAMVDAYVALEKINATLIPTSRLQRAYQYLQTCFSNRPSCWLPLAFSTSLKSHNCARGVVYLKQSLYPAYAAQFHTSTGSSTALMMRCAGGKDPVIDGVKFEL
ncbi:hypothetical protein KPL70_015965 [Citrus sinensis]|nr:hypothetical protein KPL70_015965 [Citrus sinensis]